VEISLNDLRKIAERAKTDKEKKPRKSHKSSPRTAIKKTRETLRKELNKTFDMEADLLIATVLEKLKTAARHPKRVVDKGLFVKARVKIALAHSEDLEFGSPCVLRDDDATLYRVLHQKVNDRNAGSPIRFELVKEPIGSCEQHYLEARANLEHE